MFGPLSTNFTAFWWLTILQLYTETATYGCNIKCTTNYANSLAKSSSSRRPVIRKRDGTDNPGRPGKQKS
ncbi:hypothetical protein PF005_g5372 [Phytophthora fragariae]|uniref:Secreted protein n=1 Tax=Phytophthora fragariae TaxID=53985 RepID=A0A6A4DML4_9STRA|nr:hypothetical protein PF003_g28291 [Phytophthora fragariae]KAE8944258.1 hypothetical protein PF009_g6055 [Phytophthora fragariae]KAE9009481.1 hypothetical protein PF011_g10252 [Phytophthora fragariae]KAE9111340.1 hypothetical protein PF010_g10840 [Phytophthora fragariae]KAE9128559.1 hypothetical protein PF007_g5219 [Phytophthora fragariae]